MPPAITWMGCKPSVCNWMAELWNIWLWLLLFLVKEFKYLKVLSMSKLSQNPELIYQLVLGFQFREDP